MNIAIATNGRQLPEGGKLNGINLQNRTNYEKSNELD